ncbi:MAG: OsmC family protein [Candidatus Dormibacteraeota bacterium]|nr:OsmC family protein [Candidatus Dormibacteraeota bacterium]
MPDRYSSADVLAGRAGKAELIDIQAAARWVGGLQSEITAGRHTLVSDEPTVRGGEDAGPTPLQLVLAGLCACETVTMRRLSRKLRIRIDSFEIGASAVIDARGRNAEAPVPAHFVKVEVRVRLRTAEPDDRVQRLKELVEGHCPVATLLLAAPLQFNSVWEKVP